MDKRSGRRAALRGKRVALAVATAFLPWGEAYSLPTGENVVAGQVTVSRPDPQRMQIDQASQKGIVNWQGFSIGVSEHVNITQPSSAAALLNRVIGNSPSEIFGRLTANGQVFLVNNAGVLFAPGASVEVGSLLASTLSITDQNFLNGNYQFYNPGNAGSVVNQGNIFTANGYTALIGPQVRNDGVIVAQVGPHFRDDGFIEYRGGSVALAAGDRVSLDMIGDGLISVSVDQAAFNASLVNTGSIDAPGGRVLLTARSANALLDTVINNEGVIRATSIVQGNGEILLGAIVLEGGPHGISTSGELQAGEISITGGSLTVNSFVNSSGTMNLDIDGAVTVAASGIKDASLTSFGGQNINAKSVEITSRDGRFASIGNNNAGDQTITVSGGGIAVHSVSGGGFAFITNSGSGGQIITVSDGSGVDVRSVSGGGSGQINNFGLGDQTITVSGGGGVEVQTLSGNGFAIINDNGPGSQTITVSDGSGVGVRSVSSGSQISNFGSGSQTITVSGGTGVEVQTLSGNGFFATIVNGGSGNQTISVSGSTAVDVVSAGGSAHISNVGPGSQMIAVSGGKGIDVQSNGGNASINQSAPGLAQIIAVSDADHINVNGAGGSANISANGGTQTLSITGGGANAITFGSLGALGFSQMAGGSTQNVIAGLPGGQGSITIVGPAANNTAASIVSRAAAGGTQTIETSGLLSIAGGTAPNQNFPSGIFHNGSGAQTISAAGIALTGGPSGRGNTAQIGSIGGGVVANAGNQVINVPDGTITLRGSDGGINNRASIFSNGNQTINGNPDLLLMAGASSIAGAANAGILTAPGRSQTIHAGNITLENAQSGTDSFAGILSTHQVISATENVVLTGRGTGGTLGGVRIGGMGGGATDLRLTVGGNLELMGGAVAGNGAAIGSSTAVPPQPNDLTIDVTGNLVMTAGAASGVRIGSAGTGTAGGNISITAGGNIEMNGTSPDAPAAIRTLGTVRLAADNISQNADGLIIAGTLNTISDGSTSLAGPNQVSSFRDSSATGDIRFNNSSSLLTVSSITAQGISISQSGGLAITGNVVSTGPQTIAATGDIRVGTDANSVEVRAGGPITLSSGGNLVLAGGSADGSHALLFGSSDINLTVGGLLTINEGSGTDAWARIQTETRDSAINIFFPNLSSGGYFVNDIEGALRRGHTGLLSGEGVAVPDHTLFITYGGSD